MVRHAITGLLFKTALTLLVALSGTAAMALEPVGPSLHPQAVKGLSFDSACKTTRDYKRLYREIDRRTKRHFNETSKIIRSGVDFSLPFSQRMVEIRKQHKKLQADRKKLQQVHARSKFGSALAVDCVKYPRSTVVVEKSTSFDVMVCIKSKSWPSCLWTDKRVLRRYFGSTDKKTWRRSR